MNKHARYEEKRDLLICWILEFQYTTINIFCMVMKLKRTNQSRFILSLKKSGLFHFVKSPLHREEIIILSKLGREYSAMLSPKHESYSMTQSRITSSTLVHSLQIQKSIIRRCDDIKFPFNFFFEKSIHDIEVGKRPDALIDFDGTVTALEIELTQKNNKRIYLGFLEQIENMRQGHYANVEYVFLSDSMTRIYQNKFDAESWPKIERMKVGGIRQHLSAGELVYLEVPEKIRDRFKFTCDGVK